MKNILAKLLKIQQEIDTMSKDGYNDFNRYNYLSEAQVTVKIKELLDSNGVLFQYQSQVTDIKEYTGGKGDTQFLVTVRINYAFYDVETAEKLEGIAYGQGMDKGDKGVYKAITGAVKYIYMKMFNIPTGDDCEKDSPSVKKSESKKDIKYNLPTSTASSKANSNITNSSTKLNDKDIKTEIFKLANELADKVDPIIDLTKRPVLEGFIFGHTQLKLIEENYSKIADRLSIKLNELNQK